MSYTSYIYEINPKLPFTDILELPIERKYRVTVKGQISTNANSFAINILHGNEELIAYHFRPYCSENGPIVQNTCKPGVGWMTEEKVQPHILMRGNSFTIVIESKEDHFETTINEGKQKIKFQQRIPEAECGSSYKGIQIKNASDSNNDVSVSLVKFEIMK